MTDISSTPRPPLPRGETLGEEKKKRRHRGEGIHQGVIHTRELDIPLGGGRCSGPAKYRMNRGEKEGRGPTRRGASAGKRRVTVDPSNSVIRSVEASGPGEGWGTSGGSPSEKDTSFEHCPNTLRGLGYARKTNDEVGGLRSPPINITL